LNEKKDDEMIQKPNSIELFLKEIEMTVDKNRPKSSDEFYDLVEHKAIELDLPLNLAEAFVNFYCKGLTKGLAITFSQSQKGEPYR